MGKFFDSILPKHMSFIECQNMFFVATAPLNENGLINISPKGLDSFKVLNANKVAYMDLISSGNETSAHTLENGRITFMFCSFDKVPNILRLYGKAKVILPNESEWPELSAHFKLYNSTRQIVVADITKVQTSCGYGVPEYEFKKQREIHFDWANKKGEEGLRDYVIEHNLTSLDGLNTHLGQKQNQAN